MNPLWSGEPRAADVPPQRRHARLYDAEYAKQLERTARIRRALGGASTPRAHRSWDDPPAAVALVAEPPPVLLEEAPPAAPESRGDARPPQSPRHDRAATAVPAPHPPRRVRPAPLDEPTSPGLRPAPVDEPTSPRVRPALAGVLAAAALCGLAGGLLLARGGGGPEADMVRLPAPVTDLVASGAQLWAAAPQAGAVWVLDEDGTPVGPAIRVDGTPARLAVGAGAAWAADTAHGALVRMRGRRASRPLRIGPDVAAVALAGDAIWAASAADGTVRVLAPGRRTRAIAIGGHPIALAADARSVVAATADGTVAWLDARTRRAVAWAHVDATPVAVALAGGAAWIADARGGALLRVTRAGSELIVAPRVAVGRSPAAIAAVGDDVYVAGDRTVTRIDARRGVVAGHAALAIEPAALAVDAEYVWIAAAGSSVAQRIDRRRLS